MIELLTTADLAALLKITPSQLRRRVRAGLAPKPFYPAPGSPRWRRAAVEAWLAEREREVA